MGHHLHLAEEEMAVLKGKMGGVCAVSVSSEHSPALMATLMSYVLHSIIARFGKNLVCFSS